VNGTFCLEINLSREFRGNSQPTAIMINKGEINVLKKSLEWLVFLNLLAGSSGSLAAFGAPVQPTQEAFPSATTMICLTTPQRITVPPNGYASSMNYQLPASCTEANFFISGKQGQLMVLVLSSPGAVRAEISAPDGKSDGQPVENGGVIFSKILTRTGDYKIRISKSLMAKPWAGQIILTAVVQPNI
jgi:hypothetical protein